MEIKDVLRQRRQALGMTLKEVADAVGVSEATVSRWESCYIQLAQHKKKDPLPLLGEGFFFMYMRKGTGPVPAPCLSENLGGFRPRLSVHGSRM